jgi:hypothetical protein
MGAMKGGSKLEAKLREIAEKAGRANTVRVGFLEGATYPDGTSVAMVGAIQEYGAPSVGIPSRPYFRGMIAEHKQEWGPELGQVIQASDYDASKALGLMGKRIEEELQDSIRKLDGPELSQVTLLLRERFWSNPQEIKGADVVAAREDVATGTEPDVTDTQKKPLVWTGHLLNSVSSEVTDK